MHYASFGIRKLMFRLRAGLPCSPEIWAAYQSKYGIKWYADKEGPGGILEVEPESDAGTYGEEYFNAKELLSELAPIRDLLASGDLRPLYLMWLACGDDEETLEPPVPAGLFDLPPELETMADFYEIGSGMLAAVAECSAELDTNGNDISTHAKKWIAGQSKDELKLLVERMLTEDPVVVRAETLARIRDGARVTQWPTAAPSRTFAQLRERAEVLDKEQQEEEARAKEEARRERLAQIVANRQQLITQACDLVKTGGTNNYELAAVMVVELRDALGSEQAEALATTLRTLKPSSNILAKTLRRHGLLGKRKGK